MGFIKGDVDSIIIQIISGIALFIIYLFLNWVVKKIKYNKKKEIAKKIIKWFNYIDKNLTENGLNNEHLNHIEKEIDFLFSLKKYSKLKLKFSKKYIRMYLKKEGIKKENRTEKTFIERSKLTHPNIDLILGLESRNKKQRISILNTIFSLIWSIIRGNYYLFSQQHLSNRKDIEFKDRITILHIEEPVKLLKKHFKIY